MRKRAVVIGAGINGLVSANYLQRHGFDVTILEIKAQVGGACTFDYYHHNDKKFIYPTAATVLGLMQDFVFEETGLKKRLSVHTPHHPAVIWLASQEEPCLLYDDIGQLTQEVNKKWGETGNVSGFFSHLDLVRQFIINGYRQAQAPSLEAAEKALGKELTQLWITGSAKDLVDHYFTSEPMKVFQTIEVNESGPVPIDSKCSAFSIPLMHSGSIFGGEWGYVKGGLWKLVEELANLNCELGAKIITSAKVISASSDDGLVTYEYDGKIYSIAADHIIFANDPVSAAKIVGDNDLIATTTGKKMLGTSGKLVMFFGKPVVWKNNTNKKDFDSAFKFIIAAETLDQIEAATQEVVVNGKDYCPGYFEIYSEGAGMRKLGLNREYDAITIFFKNLAFNKKGEELEWVRQAVISAILQRVENGQDLLGSVLFTPKDLNERFFFPQGNIDHIELAEGQTYFSRHFSADPAASFYQFGKHKNIRYCAAGSYPCGSIAGTPGYMCATQLIESQKKNPLEKSN